MITRLHNRSALICMLVVAAGAAAGPLSPPSGPVTSTNKTLQEVEPRIAVNSTNTPGANGYIYRITQPGSYYLTGNVTSGSSGIDIAANDVTLDLNGFTINGGSYSINASIVCSGITIRNGHVRGSVNTGIRLFNADQVLIENISAINIGGTAIATGDSAVVRNCTVNGAAAGFALSGPGRVVDCRASACESGFMGAAGSEFSGCIATNCTANGFEATATGVRLVDCIATSCTTNGFLFTSGVTIDRCTARSSGRGFDIGDNSVLTNSMAIANTGQGGRVGSQCTVTSNVFRQNGAASDSAGLWIQGSGNQVESNQMTSNDWGLWVDGTDNVIIRNTARANTTANYGNIAAGNEMAPVITGPGSFSTSNYFSNFAH